MIAAACIGAALGVLGSLHGPVGLRPALAAPPAVSSASDPAAEDTGAEARFNRALADLKARRFHEAAVGFEDLWREGRSTRVLSFAAQAREGAGHWAHAIQHMRALLAEESGMEARTRKRVTTWMTAARRHTMPLVVRLRSEQGVPTDVRLTLRRVAPDELRPLLELAVEDGRVLDVDPGVWSLTVRAPGFVPVQRVFAVLARPRRGAVVAEEVVFTLEPITVPTVLTLEPAAVAAGAQWTLTPGEGAGGLRMIGGAEAREQLSLAPGRWRARVEAAGYVAQEITWVAGEEEPPAVTLVAEAVAPELPPRPVTTPREVDPGRWLGLGLGLGGGVTFGVGLGLLVQNRATYAHFVRAPDNAAFVAALTASAAGSGMLGAGLGLGIAAVTAAFPVRTSGSGITDRGLWIELGVGGGVALIGAAWYAGEWKRVQRDLYGQSEAPDVQAQHRETAAAAFLGAGVGLAAGAGVVLLTRYLVRHGGTRRAGLGGGPGVVGLGVHGRF